MSSTLEMLRNHLTMRCCFHAERQSKSHGFRSWNSLFVSCVCVFPVSLPDSSLLSDDVSRNACVLVVSWHGLTAFIRPRQPVRSPRNSCVYIRVQYISTYVHSRVSSCAHRAVITLSSRVFAQNYCLSYRDGSAANLRRGAIASKLVSSRRWPIARQFPATSTATCSW